MEDRPGAAVAFVKTVTAIRQLLPASPEAATGQLATLFKTPTVAALAVSVEPRLIEEIENADPPAAGSDRAPETA